MNVVIVNDTYDPPYFGSRMVMDTLRRQCIRIGFRIIGTVSVSKRWHNYQSMLDQADFIIVNGEGSLHHNHRNDLIEIAREYPCALINAMYQDNSETLDGFDFTAARDMRSYTLGHFDYVAPDLSFGYNVSHIQGVAHESHIILTSVIAADSGNTPIHCDPAITLAHIRLCDRITTGRFHGLCAAIRFGKPVWTMPTNSHKIIALLEEIDMLGAQHGFTETTEKARQYVAQAPARIDEMFDRLKECGDSVCR